MTKLKCSLQPVSIYRTLADLPPGVAAKVNFGRPDSKRCTGIRWRDSQDNIYSITSGFPVITRNSRIHRRHYKAPKLCEYKVLEVLGKIEMEFTE